MGISSSRASVSGFSVKSFCRKMFLLSLLFLTADDYDAMRSGLDRGIQFPGGGTTTTSLYDTLAVPSSDTLAVVRVDSTSFQGGLNSAAIVSTSVNGDNVPESRAEGNLVDILYVKASKELQEKPCNKPYSREQQHAYMQRYALLLELYKEQKLSKQLGIVYGALNEADSLAQQLPIVPQDVREEILKLYDQDPLLKKLKPTELYTLPQNELLVLRTKYAKLPSIVMCYLLCYVDPHDSQYPLIAAYCVSGQEE